ncbi:MAG: hypothetical protein ACR2P0_19720 [Acidimicrobiales bacterium]
MGDDVDRGEMARRLTDEELAALLSGGAIEDTDHPVGTFFADARREVDDLEAPAPNAALAEFLNVGVSTPHTTNLGADALEIIDLDTGAAPKRSTARMISTVSAFVATAAGKVAIGGTVALAAASGAHVAGVVDVPVLPDVNNTAVVEMADDESTGLAEDSSSSSSSTTSSTTSTTSTTAPAETPGADTAPNELAPADEQMVIDVPNVGSVTVVAGANLSLADAAPLPGWSVDEIEESPRKVEVRFSDGSNEVDVNVEFEDGAIRVRIRDEAADSEETSWFDLDGVPLADEPIDDDDDDGDGDDDSDDDDDHDDSDDDDDHDDSDDDEDEEDESDDEDDSDDDLDDDESDDE